MFTKTFRNSGNLFLIAEIGGNHEGDLAYAKKLLQLAIDGGADAVKFQIYQGDTIVSKVEDPDRNRHFKKFELGLDGYKELAVLAAEKGVHFMSSIWDEELFYEFDPYIQIHKIGSGDLTNYPLLKAIALSNKPLIVATAMSELEEIQDMVSYIDSVNPDLIKENKLCLMQCVAMYGDLNPAHANLGAIRVLQETFPHIHIGYSDHTEGIYAAELSIALGARVLELHFTDDKTREFRDHHLSVTASELVSLRQQSKRIDTLLGKYEKRPVEAVETKKRIKEFRRAVYLKQDTEKGTIISEEMLTTLRPNVGIDARKYFSIIGKTLRVDKKGTEALSESDFE